MVRDEIIASLLGAKAKFEEQGVAHMALFGSRSRGEAHPHSDLDLLLDIPTNPNFSILELLTIEQMIEDQTGLATNVILKRSLTKEFEKSISADLVEVF